MTTPVSPQQSSVPSYVEDEIDFKDFTLERNYVGFKIDGDKFIASAKLGIATIQALVRVAEEMPKYIEKKEYGAIYDILDQVLLPESARRMRERGLSTGPDTIDVQRQLMPVIYYLLEQFGLRPTQPSSTSSSGPPGETSGITLTGGAPGTGSIQLT